MGIFQNSRYTKTEVITHEGTPIFKIRKRFNFTVENSQIYIFKEGDHLDTLAYKYYGDTQLWWVILEANIAYKLEIDIPVGAEILIPSREEVLKCLQ